MFRDLMNWAFKQADVTPTFASQHCLAVRGGGCRACAEVCPHDAITITRTVKIEPIDCTGCGLCVAVCPSFALAPRERVVTDHAVRCSAVQGETTSVVCLARLQASDVVRMAAPGRPVTLARSDCANCDIGGAEVPAAIERAAAEARELLALHGRTLELEVVEVERFEIPRDRVEITRRDLLRGGWKEIRRSSSVLLAPLEGFAEADEDDVDRRALPVEHQRRIRAIALAKPEPDAIVPLRLPEVSRIIEVFDEDCIFRKLDDASFIHARLYAVGHPHETGFVSVIGEERSNQLVGQDAFVGEQLRHIAGKKAVFGKRLVRRFARIETNRAA